MEKIISVGIMGREIQNIPVTDTTRVKDLAISQNINYSSVKGSINGIDTFNELNEDSLINGYKAILFTPKIDGGKGYNPFLSFFFNDPKYENYKGGLKIWDLLMLGKVLFL